MTIKLPVRFDYVPASMDPFDDTTEWRLVDDDGAVIAWDDIAAALNATATPDSDRLPPPATELDTWSARCHGIAAEYCPFCDGVADVWSLLRDGYATTPDDPDARAYWCRCRACGCNGGWAKSEGGARHWWSMRTLNATATAPDLTATLERIVALVNEWEANGLGGVAVQRKRWQKLGEIARAALTKDGTP